MVFKILILFCLAFLFYQDWRHRAVYWLVFPVMLVLLGGLSFSDSTLSSVSEYLIFNTGFLISQLILLTIYFSVKEKRLVNISRNHLGWGDILFLFCLCFYLSPVNYLFFYISSLFLLAVCAIVLVMRNGDRQVQIPLAGLQGLFFMLFLAADWSSSSINLQDDSWLLSHFDL